MSVNKIRLWDTLVVLTNSEKIIKDKLNTTINNENGKSNVLDCKSSDIHPDDEDENPQDNSNCSEDEGNQSEPENLIYAIKDDAKGFRSAVSSCKNAPECLKKFKVYQEKSSAQANSMGLFVNAHLYEILSLNNIILLKKDQSHPEIDMSDLHKAMLDEYKNHEKVDQKTFMEIIEAFRMDDIDSSRDELKIMLFKIYESARKEDRKVIDVLINLINKLPNKEILDCNIEEQELITSYIDPILSPILHRPEGNNLFLCKRPDAGCALVYDRRIINYPGFVEVKAEYKKKNSICLHEDLLRLSLFGMNALEETNAKCILLLQIIGPSLTVYGCAEHEYGPNIVFEIMKFKIPLSLRELPGFIMRLDDLKHLDYLYHERCINRLETKKRKYSLSQSKLDLDEIINSHTPKSLKSSIDF
ncbi:hypothetical protein G6F46_012261 [Rhizopus delemar]|uniref:Uncharacterized protein n=2 Tax=Rhizopus TaxID=4842 RepID=A0A9P7CIN1_9FUNG|nr:hypothetical protein G6F55_008830 [Rhizopus delemar]KAG1548687.1 hypothetical protein G6F51_003521 [Rhizopus arrhizus]KAG1488302.1 hypothetical protein G6F54_012144 [Rhizopus delemar]KAG1496575.1 hypothetical protein G6F53_012152 [Rhizopus delemar]KAG1510182.1 hypothetical protein G6F52_010966 [Rhizopus delemar]